MTENNSYPILDFDPDKQAIIQPEKIYKTKDQIPEFCIICFYLNTVKKIIKENNAVPVYTITGQGEPIILYRILYKSKPVLIVFPGIGAPIAGAVLDICIALGTKKIIACGSAGVLYSEIKRDKIILIDSAVRDDGMSYHYATPSAEISSNREVLKKMENFLISRSIEFIKGKVWTTDAIFRETRAKIKKRKEQGCIAVEMESSALIAIADFRGVLFGQLVMASDDISKDEWDQRQHGKKISSSERLLYLSMDICISI